MEHPAADFWTNDTSVLFTSADGWGPHTWGTIGWTGEKGRTRRNDLLKELSNPFIAVVYVTRKRGAKSNLKGKVAGFYLFSHETGDRNEYTHPIHHGLNVGKWQHSLRALRAFSYLPEHCIEAADLDPDTRNSGHAQWISARGKVLVDPEQIERLRTTPWVEVEVYTSASASRSDIGAAGESRGMVRAGPASREGHVVSRGSYWLPRELYILRLDGNVDAYLGPDRTAEGRAIIKIGLSASPELRRQSFQNAMPKGAFRWKIDRTTVSCGLKPYPNHAVAVKGEYAMKKHLAKHAEWLGGEFYLATESDIEAAWQSGCRAADKANE